MKWVAGYLIVQLAYLIWVMIHTFRKHRWETVTSIKFYFKWFDFWVGTFTDVPKKRIYFQLVPMLGVMFQNTEE